MEGRMGLAFPRLTPFVKGLIITLLAVFVLTLIAQNWLNFPLFTLLALHPASLHPLVPVHYEAAWQIFTHPLVDLPSAANIGGFLIGLLFIWLMLSPFESRFGSIRTAQLCIFATLGASLPCVILGLAGIASEGAFLAGATSLTLASLSAFAALQRGSVIHFFGVIPMKAWVVVAISVGYALLIFLATGNTVALVGSLGAIASGYAFVAWMARAARPKKAPVSARRRSHPPKGPKLRVLPGGQLRLEENDDDSPDDPKYLN